MNKKTRRWRGVAIATAAVAVLSAGIATANASTDNSSTGNGSTGNFSEDNATASTWRSSAPRRRPAPGSCTSAATTSPST